MVSPIRGGAARAYTFVMNTMTLIAILASMIRPSRPSTPPVETYEWVAGEVKRWEVGDYSNWSERLDSPRK